MARTQGIFNFSANLEVKKNAPLDARTVVGTKLELTSTATWADSDNKVWLYDGIVVSVLEDHSLYMLNNYDPVSAPTAYTDEDNWVLIDATAAITDVEDSLTSTSTTKALSANQGKVLDEKIAAVKSSITSVYNYKGSKDTFAEIEALSNSAVGDVWDCKEAHNGYPAGTNWAWTGDSWDALGGSVDLSGYYTKTETDSAIESKIDEKLEEANIVEDLSSLKSTVQANSEALLIINSDSETQAGSLKKVLKDAKDYTDTQLTNYVEKVEGSSLITSEKLALIDTNAEDISELKTKVEANTAGLLKLNGTAELEGSILNIVKTNIESALEWKEL